MKMDHFNLIFFWEECHDASICVIHKYTGKKLEEHLLHINRM